MKVLPQIRSYDSSFFRERLFVTRDILSTAASINIFEQARYDARKLCASAFDNLDDYPYIYFTSGITEAIDFLLLTRETFARENEYRYIFSHRSISPKNPVNLEYRSYPFSGDGLFDGIPETHEVILDCSYMFASNMNNPIRILPKNVSHVMFGLSKSHNVADLRVGWFFSKKRYLHLHTLQYAYGYGASIPALALKVALDYKPNELYLQYKDSISEKFSRNNLIEGDTNLFGLNQEGERIPFYIL